MAAWRHGEPNPITNYAVAVEFRGQLSQGALRAIAAAHPKIRLDLPRKVEQQSITFQMLGPQFRMGAAQLPPTPVQGLGGVVFDTLNSDGTMRAALSTTPNATTYMTTHYTRWAEFWPVAERLVQTVLTIVKPEPVISALTLNSVNKFYPEDNAALPLLDTLLARGSPFVAPNLLEIGNFGHSFHGFVVPEIDPVGQRVDNVNVAWSPQMDSNFAVDITFQIRRALKEGLSLRDAFTVEGTEKVSAIDKMFLDLHKRNNVLFMNVVNSAVWAGIPGLSL